MERAATERRAQRAFERAVLRQIVALSPPDGGAPAEPVEQALGYYRHVAEDNPAQQVLARRLRAALAALYEQGLLDPAAAPDTLVPTPAGRALIERDRWPWWRRLCAALARR